MRLFGKRIVNAKLRTKFLLSFAAIILVTVLMISIINYIVSVGAIKRNSGEFSEYLIGQIGINLEKRTADIEDIAFQQFRSSSLSEQLGAIATTDNERYFRDKYINDFLNELLFYKDYFENVWIIDTDGRQFAINRDPNHAASAALLKRFDPQEIQDKRGRAKWFQVEDGTVYMVRAMYDILSSRYVGTIAIGLEKSYIGSIVTGVRNVMDGDILILNEDGESVVQNDQSSEVAGFFLQNKRYLLNDLGKEEFAFGRKHYIATVSATAYGKWRVVQIIGVDQLTRGTSSIKYGTISTIAVALAIGFLMAAFLSKNITENVGKLLQSMSRFSVDFNHRVVVPRSKDEIGLLAEKFNSMADKINDLFNTVYREKLLKQKAEYRTLQFEYKALLAQMNPHFLYNTLESIHSLAKLRGEKEIGEMVYLLGTLLRESIGKRGDIIALEEEISFIRLYLSIHQIIYGNQIEVNYELDERLMECRVPKFILQPLVENSVLHGIEEKPGIGVIRIVCRQEADALIVEVADNGIGMDADTVKRLLNPDVFGSFGDKDKHTNVGVISVQKRVRILYGDEYGLSIESAPGDGTTVRIRLPLVAPEEEPA